MLLTLGLSLLRISCGFTLYWSSVRSGIVLRRCLTKVFAFQNLIVAQIVSKWLDLTVEDYLALDEISKVNKAQMKKEKEMDGEV